MIPTELNAVFIDTDGMKVDFSHQSPPPVFVRATAASSDKMAARAGAKGPEAHST